MQSFLGYQNLFGCRKGDYYRYLAEFRTGNEKKEAADQSKKAYEVRTYILYIFINVNIYLCISIDVPFFCFIINKNSGDVAYKILLEFQVLGFLLERYLNIPLNKVEEMWDIQKSTWNLMPLLSKRIWRILYGFHASLLREGKAYLIQDSYDWWFWFWSLLKHCDCERTRGPKRICFGLFFNDVVVVSFFSFRLVARSLE